MDQAATSAAAAQWGAEPVMSDMEALMWRSEASPRLRSGGVIVDLLDATPDWDRLVGSHEWAGGLVGRVRPGVGRGPPRAGGAAAPARGRGSAAAGGAGLGGRRRLRSRLPPAAGARARGGHVRRRAGH